ncbi:MAG TPA: PAS domain-containing protein [Microvirga sp.]|nr:PAS domain-containing protein [Microvirga sp.]
MIELGMPVECRPFVQSAGRGPAATSFDPFALSFAAARMAMIITDPRQPDNPIVFANDAFSRLTGYARAEVVGRNCRFLQGRGTDPQAVDHLRERFRAGEGAEVEILNYRKDGTPFWNSLVISPVRSDAGDLLYYFASQHDVSDKKAAEVALTNVNHDLEEQIAHRTRDLRLALDQKTALLHEVDHRVKNTLQVIASLVHLKARRTDDERSRRVLLNLADQVNALSTAHRLLYAPEDVSRFDLAAFLEELMGDLVAPLPSGRIAVDLQAEPLAVSAAKAAPLALLIHEVVSNALAHAYPDDRRGRLLVRAEKLDGNLRIVIEDDGVGYSPSPAQAGFGRTLIDLLVRQVKGRIEWRRAEPGTRVTLTMPLDAEEALF